MKFGETFERESVRAWSFHNFDYVTLKGYIKAHTTKDQATAITIPGHQDTALLQFENDLYDELCRQHDRIGLFVITKADEEGRRLEHISGEIEKIRLQGPAGKSSKALRKRRHQLVTYERELVLCAAEIRNLSRFTGAQVVAFRKILKKYKKWTGSGTLSSRFKDAILSDPKSFTKRDFTDLLGRCEEMLATVRAETPASSEAGTPEDPPSTPSRRRSAQFPSRSAGGPLHQSLQIPTSYWNEYDDGSETGDLDGGYVIYVNPDEETKFPGIPRLVAWFSMPLAKAKSWMGLNDGEHGPLLPTLEGSQQTVGGYGATHGIHTQNPFGSSPHSPTAGHGTDTDEDEAFASDAEFPRGYETYYAALPSVNEQMISRYREHVLFWSTIGSFAASFIFLGVAAILVTTGRHRLRVEVDAGATMGVIASLTCASAAVALTLARKDPLGLVNRIAIWLTFAVVCVLDGMVLVLVVGNSSL